MGIEVEFISKEFIKPSSPTPHYLRKHKFSFIDQNQYPVSMPFILFYANSNSISTQEKTYLLKQSLSKALTIFYPLAGRITNYSFAECNDQGALFIESKANCDLSDILHNRNLYHNNSKKFIPLQPEKGIHQYGSLFQVTYFNCGGLAVSFAMPHMLGDALSMFVFLNGWAGLARGDKVETPSFASDSIFPARSISGFDLTQWVFKENVVTKSFVFDASTVSALRDKYSANGENMSLVRALSVFILSRIWKATTSRAKEGDRSNKCMVINSANVRQVLDPPISKRSFGNLAWSAAALIDNMDNIDKDDGYYEFVKRVKSSIKSVNAESLRKVKKGELNFDKEAYMESLKGQIVKYLFSSLCYFPVYEVDFGWGKPEWVTTSGMIFDNLIICLDTKEGQGIEAWISLTEEDMVKFEKDEQLLSHLSAHPNLNSRL